MSETLIEALQHTAQTETPSETKFETFHFFLGAAGMLIDMR